MRSLLNSMTPGHSPKQLDSALLEARVSRFISRGKLNLALLFPITFFSSCTPPQSARICHNNGKRDCYWPLRNCSLTGRSCSRLLLYLLWLPFCPQHRFSLSARSQERESTFSTCCLSDSACAAKCLFCSMDMSWILLSRDEVLHWTPGFIPLHVSASFI